MELYIVRHGTTIWNQVGRLQGHAEISLDDSGRKAATALGQRLKETPFDYVFSSPLIRARETAYLICLRKDRPICLDDRMMEISFGDLEGATYDEFLDEKSPHRFFFSEPDKYLPPKNGESFESVCARTKDFIQKEIEPIYQKNPNARILLVGHGAVNKGAMCYLEGNDLAHYWGDGLQKNCEAAVFSYDGSVWTQKGVL